MAQSSRSSRGLGARLVTGEEALSWLESRDDDPVSSEWTRAVSAAASTWGIAGIGVPVSTGDSPQWRVLILVVPSQAIPSDHPLAKGGVDPATAGLLYVQGHAGANTSALRELFASLTQVLGDRISGMEAQSSLRGSHTAPACSWLSKMGFTSMTYPRGRYRFDFPICARGMEVTMRWVPRRGLAVATGQATSSRA